MTVAHRVALALALGILAAAVWSVVTAPTPDLVYPPAHSHPTPASIHGGTP